MTSNGTAKNRVLAPSTLKWVPVAMMIVHPDAQRPYQAAHAEHLAANFDVEKLGYPVLNEVDGVYYIVDGQHRVEAVKLIGWGDQQLHCQVFKDLTVEQMADLFLGKNDYRVVASLSRFRNAVTAGYERECDIDRIVRHHNCAVTYDKIDGAIGAVGTLIRIYDRSGPGILSRTIRIIRDAYGSSGFDSAVLDGIGLLCARYNVKDLEDQLIIAKLGNVHGGVKGLIGRAYLIREQMKVPLNQAVAAAAVEVINQGRGGKKLPSWFREDAA